jgi:hypothetical protein
VVGLERTVAARGFVGLIAALGASPVMAQAPASTAKPAADTTVKITFGAFLDTYYGWDFNRPKVFDRSYTTQPARHAEFNVNLAYAEAKLSAPRLRGRFALQFGTSVQSNYAGEPRIGHVSGPGVSQFIQEATAGYRLTPRLWIDGGIFFAHTGLESWISRDNLAYTRSLNADFSPYYEAGLKLTWSPSSAVTAQVDLLNGWQNISKYNTPPAIGIRIDYVARPAVTLSYDNFFGDVAADGGPAHYRLYHDLFAQVNPSSHWQLAGVFSLGIQSRSAADGRTATWYGASVLAKYRPRPEVGIVARLERYADPDRVIIQTALGDSFRTNGASLGLDVTLASRLLWRTEVRGFHSSGAVWPLHDANAFSQDDWIVVGSFALTF